MEFPGSVPMASDPATLPRGVYDWNAGAYDWDRTGDSLNLVLNWTFDDGGASQTARLTVDWGETVTVGEQELPQNAEVGLAVGGQELGGGKAEVSWQSVPGCGLIMEPASVTASGYLGDDSGKISLDSFKLQIPQASGVISTSGKVTASSASDSISFNWDIAANGSVERDPVTCGVTGAEVTSGSVQLGAAANDESLGIGFGFGGLVVDSRGVLQSVEITNGALRVNGGVAVRFAGKVTSGGDVGDQLLLTFANDERMTLNEFIRSNFAEVAGMALRALR